MFVYFKLMYQLVFMYCIFVYYVFVHQLIYVSIFSCINKIFIFRVVYNVNYNVYFCSFIRVYFTNRRVLYF